jgi:hypothetical protein
MALRTWKSPAEIVDTLMEYVPTFWIRARHVHNALPHEVKELYNERMRVNQFLRKFQFYFDAKVTNEGPFVKVRDTCNHPKKGFADDRYASSLLNDPTAAANAANLGGGLGVDAQTLEGRLRAVLSDELVPIADIEAKLPPDVQQHKDYDKAKGLAATLELHPHYFQVIEGKARKRPIGVAPNALSDLTVETSPLPEVFRRLYALVPEDSAESAKTSTLFAELTAEEKQIVKQQFRSFPRFLRLHGRVMSVTPDNMTVRRFCEVLPDDVDVGGSGLGGGGGAADMDIIGKRLPHETSFDASPLDLAIKELHEALPLLSSVPLEDAVFMLPAGIRTSFQGLDLAAELREYPSYFSVWEFPDDPKVIVVQRASVETPEIPAEEMISTVHPLVPQGGIDAERLMRKVPLNLQRYFYRHGLKKTLQGFGQQFLVVGDRVLAIGM